MWHVLALRLGATVAELRRRMTRSEFYRWIAFARVYPLLEATAEPTQTIAAGDASAPEVEGLDHEIVKAFVSSSPQSHR